MARSLARPTLPAARLLLGSEGLQLPGELLDARLHRLRLAVPHVQHERPEHAQDDDDAEVDQVAHGAGSGCGTSAAGCRSVAHAPPSPPPARVSRCQTGTLTLSAPMKKGRAANASGRCGADARTTTATSVTASGP